MILFSENKLRGYSHLKLRFPRKSRFLRNALKNQESFNDYSDKASLDKAAFFGITVFVIILLVFIIDFLSS